MPALNELSDELRFHFLVLVHTDMCFARDAALLAVARAKELGDASPVADPSYSAFADAAIVRYYRGFSGCVLPAGKGKVRSPDDYAIVAGNPPNLHANVGQMRGRITAHSDMSVKDVWLERLPDQNGKPFWTLGSGGASLGPSDVLKLAAQCIGIIERLRRELRPMIDARIGAMQPGERLDLRGVLALDSADRESVRIGKPRRG